MKRGRSTPKTKIAAPMANGSIILKIVDGPVLLTEEVQVGFRDRPFGGYSTAFILPWRPHTLAI